MQTVPVHRSVRSYPLHVLPCMGGMWMVLLKLGNRTSGREATIFHRTIQVLGGCFLLGFLVWGGEGVREDPDFFGVSATPSFSNIFLFPNLMEPIGETGLWRKWKGEGRRKDEKIKSEDLGWCSTTWSRMVVDAYYEFYEKIWLAVWSLTRGWLYSLLPVQIS